MSKDSNEQSIYDGRVIGVARRTAHLPDGTELDVEMVRHPGGAAIVAIDAEERVCLLRQYRPVIEGWIWEIPAGKLEPGEPPELTARRELAEEAGREATHWESLGVMLPTPGFCTERVHLYRATGLTAVPTAHEHGEVMEVHWVPLSEARAMSRDGRIEDAKSALALLRAWPRSEPRGP
ncbi:MAG: NUDIX hydrolase [Gammaproteobacteria bacterium]